MASRHRSVGLLVEIGGDEGADFLPEGLFLGCETQIHRILPACAPRRASRLFPAPIRHRPIRRRMANLPARKVTSESDRRVDAHRGSTPPFTPGPHRLEEAAPLSDELARFGPHLAFAEDDGTARADDAAFGEKHAAARRDEARLHVERHHRQIDQAACRRSHRDVEERARDAAMGHADVVLMLGAQDEPQQRLAVGSVERLDAAMARERDFSSEYLHEVSR